METKFTQGPWDVLGEIVIAEKGHKTIKPLCSFNGRISPQEDKANAHLIAAAPDMYKEIEQDILWLQRLSKGYVIGSCELRSCILRIKTKKSLLAKARGESNE
jgi:hypothetical protein